MHIIITGAHGFIGSALCNRLSSDNKVVGIDITDPTGAALNIAWEQADLTNSDPVAALCKKHSSDVVIHCAGIAHQKIGAVDSTSYMQVNSEATEKLAKAAAQSNPDVCFVFLSSVSVYGEGSQISQITQNEKDVSRPSTISRTYGVNKGAKAQQRKNNNVIGENGKCQPSSDYAFSKLDAERRLKALYDEDKIHNLTILRLAPVYDREWSFNLDRRVLAPLNLAYIRFGSGQQKMSALARPNLVEFIQYILKGVSKNKTLEIMNVCDTEPYEFNKVIQVFKNSGIRPNRPVISVPLSLVWMLTRIAGILFVKKRKWLHSCYEKLASSLVFDNTKMLKTGFKPNHTLETIFSPNPQA